MEQRKAALIVATDEYSDPKLRRLRAPSHDADALERVLADETIGEFTVEVSRNESAAALRRRLAGFFADRHRDDTLLVHFSCHGVKDDFGALYFATHDTEMAYLDATALPAEFVNRHMSRSRSRRVALFLDCCFSGAFSRGASARAGTNVDLADRFDGRGQVVITASNDVEYAFEGEDLTGEGLPSIFTAALVEGLRTGAADRDGDGLVSIDELYDYVHERVRAETPKQTPTKWTYDVQGDLYIARNPRPPEPPELPAELLHAVRSPFTGTREGSVADLQELLREPSGKYAAAAERALRVLVDDDSKRVSDAARRALAEAGTAPVLAEIPSERTPAEKDDALPSATDGVTEKDRQTVVQPAQGKTAPRPGPLLEKLQLLGDSVSDVAFSPDGSLLAVAVDERVVEVLDVVRGRRAASLTLPGAAWKIVYTPDGRLLAACRNPNGRGIVIYDVERRTKSRPLDEDEGWSPVAFSPTGTAVATYGLYQRTRVWAVEDGTEPLTIPSRSSANDASFSPNARYLATANNNRLAMIWDARTGKQVGSLAAGGTYGPSCVVFSPDGRLLATGGTSAAKVWRVSDGAQTTVLKGTSRVVDIAFSPDGRRLAQSEFGPDDQTGGAVRIWDLRKSVDVGYFQHTAPVRGVVYSPAGTLLATWSYKYTQRGTSRASLRIWDVDTGKELHVLTHAPAKPRSK